MSKKDRQNEQDLPGKLDNKILISHGIQKHYFQDERSQNLNLTYISLSRSSPVRNQVRVTVNHGAQWNMNELKLVV